MPISDTIYADWTPAGASNFAVCGDKLISWDIVSPFNRFVVWDLDDHTRNAYEISFDAGYEPSSVSPWSLAADATGVWICSRGASNKFLCLTKLKPDGSFEQKPTTAFGPSSMRGLWYDPSTTSFVTMRSDSGGGNVWVARIHETTAAVTDASGPNYHFFTYRPVIFGSQVFGTSSGGGWLVMPISGASVTASGAFGGDAVLVGSDAYTQSGSNTIRKRALPGGAETVYTTPVLVGPSLTLVGSDLVSCPSATTISGFNPTTNVGWVESKSNLAIAGMFSYGGNAHGKV